MLQSMKFFICFSVSCHSSTSNLYPIPHTVFIYSPLSPILLLTYFLENQGIALSREKILNSVWNYDYFGDARTIDTHVKKLRSKMGDKGEYIKTVWGMGYKFEVDE